MDEHEHNDWQDCLGDSYPMVRDAAVHVFGHGETVLDERFMHVLLGTPPTDANTREVWRTLFGDIRGRIGRIVSDADERHEFTHCMLLRNLQKAGTSRRSVGMARHLRSLFIEDHAGLEVGYASSWKFPDGLVVAGHWLVFRDAEGPAAVASMLYGPAFDDASSIHTLQGVKGRKTDLLPAADIIVRAWEPMAETGWKLFIRDDVRHPMYAVLMDRYCAGQRVERPNGSHGVVDITKKKVRELFDVDGKKDRDRHREYMFE